MFERRILHTAVITVCAWTGVATAQRAEPVRADSVCAVRGAPVMAPAARDSLLSKPARVASSATGPVDVVIFAEASAREIRFASQPQLRVRLCGGLDSIHVIDRTNLPSPVVAGTTYRDVHVAVEIFGRLNADCFTRQLLRGSSSRADTTGTRETAMDCASLEIQGTRARPPADSGGPPRR
jgi:hypothetical protein